MNNGVLPFAGVQLSVLATVVAAKIEDIGWAADAMFILSFASAAVFFALQLRHLFKAAKSDLKQRKEGKEARDG